MVYYYTTPGVFPAKVNPKTRKARGHSIVMIMLNVAQCMREIDEDKKYDEMITSCMDTILNVFVKPEEKKVAIVGGGVGIFPLISAIRAFAGEKEIFAYMGFRNKEAVCMEYEMQRGKSLTLCTDDGSLGFHGNAVQAFMKEVNEVRPDVVLSCGPTPMLRALKAAMQGRDIPTFVSLEERMGCGIGACLVCVCDRTGGTNARVCKDGPVFEIGEVEL